MKVVSTDALTKLIQLVKSAFVSKTDVEQTSEVTLATVATSGSYNDLSNKPDLSLKADDNTVVHLAGNESITGQKTFTTHNYFNGLNTHFYNDSIAYTETPSGDNNVYYGFNCVDKNKNTFSAWYAAYYRNGTGWAGINFKNHSGTTEYLGLRFDNSGTFYTQAPIPTDTTTTNSTQIATTGWVNSTGNNVVHLDGTEDITGAKTFTNVLTTYSDNGTPVRLSCSDIDVSSYVSSTRNRYFGFLDKNNVYMAGLQCHYTTSESTVRMMVRKQTDTSTAVSSLSYIGLKYPSSGDIYGYCPDWLPIHDNTHNLGNASYRWKQLYASTTTINTSDERLKQQINDIPDEILDIWGTIGFYQFKFNDAVEEKGNLARLHTGMIAQRIKKAFEDANIDPFAYGLLCYDEWNAETEELDEDGQIIIPARAAGNQYSLRYEECLCMEAAYQRRRADRLEERIAKLEKLLNSSNI